MKHTPPDELLWLLSEQERDSDATAVPDELLVAYRSGKLPADEIERIEALLSRSSRARARLAELAGIAGLVPVECARRRIFGAPSALRRPAGKVAAGWWVAAAAVAAVALVALGLTLRLQTGSPSGVGRSALPASLQFDVRVLGLSPVRGGTPGPRALPDTALRIVLEPRNEGLSGLTYALYREDGGALRRLFPGTQLRVEESRGSVSFTTAAGLLVDPSPGEHDFFVVVSGSERLPAGLRLAPGLDVEAALRSATEGLVYRATITMIDPTRPD